MEAISATNSGQTSNASFLQALCLPAAGADRGLVDELAGRLEQPWQSPKLGS